MDYKIKLTDTDPDTGDITQTIIVATVFNENYAKAITEFLSKDDCDDPNREYSYFSINEKVKRLADQYHDRSPMSLFSSQGQTCKCCFNETYTTLGIEHDSMDYDLDISICSECYGKIADIWKEKKPKKIAPI